MMQLLLGYLPPETAQWPSVLAEKRAAYAQFCAELIVDPKSGGGGSGGGVGRECGGGAAAPAADHPLSQSTDSKWHAFFKARRGLKERVMQCSTLLEVVLKQGRILVYQGHMTSALMHLTCAHSVSQCRSSCLELLHKLYSSCIRSALVFPRQQDV